MDGTLIGVGATVLVAIIGSSWRLSSQIRAIEAKVDGVSQRLDRVDPEQLRDRVTRLETRLDAMVE